MQPSLLAARIARPIALFFCLMLFAASLHAQQFKAEDKGKILLNTFYTAYLSEFAKRGPLDVKKLEHLKAEYCTSRLIKEIDAEEELDADPIINAQDANFTMVKTLRVTRRATGPGAYIVSFRESLKKPPIRLLVTLRQDRKGVKIDRVMPANSGSGQGLD